MLQIAAKWIQEDKEEIAAAKQAYMVENCASPNRSGDQAALMVSWASRFIRPGLKMEAHASLGQA